MAVDSQAARPACPRSILSLALESRHAPLLLCGEPAAGRQLGSCWWRRGRRHGTWGSAKEHGVDLSRRGSGEAA